MHISFKEYLHNKELLRRAIDCQPKQVLTYKISRYCKIPVLRDGVRVDVDVRPGFLISITWLYKNINDTNPDPITLTIDINSIEEEVEPFWKKDKFVNWINKNTNPMPFVRDTVHTQVDK